MSVSSRQFQLSPFRGQAFKEMKQYKFGADFLHPEFKQFVYGYRAEPALATASSPVVAMPTKVQGQSAPDDHPESGGNTPEVVFVSVL